MLFGAERDSDIVMVRQSDFFTEEEVEKIFKAAIVDRDQMFVKTLYHTGARISEIVGLGTDKENPQPLTPHCINFDKEIMELTNLKSKRFKRNCAKCSTLLKSTQKVCNCGSADIISKPIIKRTKTVVLTPSFVAEIKEYIQRNNIQLDMPVFPFSRFTGYRIVRKVCERAGIKVIGKDRFPHPHSFRHTYVMHSINKGIDTKLIQDQTGHSSVATLGAYFGLTEDAHEQIKRAFEKVKPNENKTTS